MLQCLYVWVLHGSIHVNKARLKMCPFLSSLSRWQETTLPAVSTTHAPSPAFHGTSAVSSQCRNMIPWEDSKSWKDASPARSLKRIERIAPAAGVNSCLLPHQLWPQASQPSLHPILTVRWLARYNQRDPDHELWVIPAGREPISDLDVNLKRTGLRWTRTRAEIRVSLCVVIIQRPPMWSSTMTKLQHRYLITFNTTVRVINTKDHKIMYWWLAM